jgi:hypothetical protein
MCSIIPAKDLMTPDSVYLEFNKIIDDYRLRMKMHINSTLRSLSPMTLMYRCVTIDVEKLMECATNQLKNNIPDKYSYVEIAMIFSYFKIKKQIPQHNLIDYVLTPITNELIKLNYDVTLQYGSSAIGNKYEHATSITFKWDHLSPSTGGIFQINQ